MKIYIVTVTNKEEFDQLMTISINEKEVVVSPKLTENVFVVCADCLMAKCVC